MKTAHIFLATLSVSFGICHDSFGQTNNTFQGTNAGLGNTGNKNSGFGVDALRGNASNNNVAVGYECLEFNSGASNIGIGYRAMRGGSNSCLLYTSPSPRD